MLCLSAYKKWTLSSGSPCRHGKHVQVVGVLLSKTTRGNKQLMGCAPGRGAARRRELQRFQGVRPAPGAVPEGVCRAIDAQVGRRGARVGVALWA